jgi:hypothetical protein
MNMSVYYDHDPETGLLVPVWILLEHYGFDWSRPLFLPIQAPFERFMADQFDPDMLVLSVPDHVYLRTRNTANDIGINLPTLRVHAEMFMESHYNISEIRRLMLRVSDIEDVLQYDITNLLKTGGQIQ